MKDILLFCPTYERGGAEQIHPETRKCLESISILYPWVEIVISKENPFQIGMYANVLHQYRIAEKLMREGGYRALFTLEHDMVIPETALWQLDSVDAPVVYGLYVFRHQKIVVNALRYVEGRETTDQPLTYYPDYYREVYSKSQIRVSGTGFGCTLIRAEALSDISFRAGDDGNPIPDLPFSQDCMKKGIKQVCNMGVKCWHFSNGSWLWPGPEGPEKSDKLPKFLAW